MIQSVTKATEPDLFGLEQQDMEGFRSIFEHAAAGMATALVDGSLLQVNPALCHYLGYTRSELVNLSAFDITHPEDLERTRTMFQQAREGKCTAHQYQKRYRHKDGSVLWGLTTVAWVRDGAGHPVYCVALIQDVTAHRAADEALQAREEIYRTLVENVDLGIALVDENHKILMVNSARARMFGRPAESFPAKHCFSEFQQGGRICEDCPGSRALQTGRAETRTSEVRLENGQRLVTRIQSFPVFNAEGRADRFIEVCENITPQVEAAQRLEEKQKHLEFLANYDQVTALPNRFLLFDRLTQMAAKCQRTGSKALLLAVGLNRFKRINETLGHEVGDQVLSEVGRRLKGCVRSSDTVARTGGTEYSVVIEDIDDLRSAVSISKKIIHACGQPFTAGGQDLFMSASIGISQFPDDGDSPGVLLKTAEVALAKAKTEPGGAYRFYTTDLDARARDLLQMESCLSRAVEHEELLLYYQPQIDLRSGRLIGVEALLRWQRPGQGLVSPADFIPLAESTGLILPMGEWALRAACQQAVAWQRQGFAPILMAANISPRQFHQPGLAEQVKRILQETGMNPGHLEIEITESTIMSDVDTAVRTMREINRLGVGLAIDDFGTGYSSLGALKLFPIRKLKVDQTFVRNLTTDSNDAAIAASVIALAKTMNLEVIAEGIETEEQLAFLRKKKCQQGQGYLFSRPIPAEQCAALLAQPEKRFFGPSRRSKR
ncbi:MAG: EAL domain-containing protein [Desulfuromonadales bacterium]|nr:EAL domain-containing protein [Desulfuromonadales bacterium]